MKNSMSLATAIALQRLFGERFAIAYLEDHGISPDVTAELLALRTPCLLTAATSNPSPWDSHSLREQ